MGGTLRLFWDAVAEESLVLSRKTRWSLCLQPDSILKKKLIYFANKMYVFRMILAINSVIFDRVYSEHLD
jgi:hypothetical protein